jgi:signal transduction histidine kinase
MQERVQLIGGKLEVQASNRGTSVAVTLAITWNESESAQSAD